MEKIYEHPIAGHSGIGKTTELVARNYYFPEIIRMARKVIKEYDRYNQMKHN